MNDEQLNELKSVVSEMFVQTDRAAAIVAVSLLNELLERALVAFFVDSKTVRKALFENERPLSSFKAKIDLAYHVGLIDAIMHADLDIIRRIRNEFAHSLSKLNFTDQRVVALCENLRGLEDTKPPEAVLAAAKPIDRFRFCATKYAYRLAGILATVPRIDALWKGPTVPGFG